MSQTHNLALTTRTYRQLAKTSEAASEIANWREVRLLEAGLWAAIVVLMVADILTTALALPHPALFESNAFADWFIVTFGALPGLTLKMVALLAVAVPLSRRLPNWARPGVLAGILGAHLVAVVSNVELLFQFGLL